MEIYTQGIGEKRFSPEEIKINFNFKIHAKTYEQTLNEGIKKVDEFTKLLEKLNFKRETFKTLAFRVYEETKYDKEKQKDVLVGYIYNHDASLIFDYDMKRLSSLIQEISKLKDGPKANISFSLKNEDKAKSACIDKAYKNVNGEAILDGKKSLGFWLDRTYINESSFSDAFATSLHELTHKYGGDESAAFSYKLTDVMQKVFEAINSNPNLAIQLKILEKAWNEQN